VVQPNGTSWDKLEYVGQVGQGEGVLQILVGQVGHGEGFLEIFVGQVIVGALVTWAIYTQGQLLL